MNTRASGLLPDARRTRILIALVLFLNVPAACGKHEPTGPLTSGITFVAGAGVSDTIGARFAQALVVQVRKPDGALARHTVVRFEVQPATVPERQQETTMFVCGLAAPVCGFSFTADNFVADTTNADGRVSIAIRFGTIAGTAVVAVSAPEFKIVDTCRFVVRPGAPAAVQTTTVNLTVEIGASAQVRAATIDRARNVRIDPLTFTADTGTAFTVDATTGVVTARDMGAQAIIASFGTFSLPIRMTAVPPGRLVVWVPEMAELRLVDLKGTNLRFLLAGIASDFGAFPSFDGSRQRVLAQTATGAAGGDSRKLVIADTSGVSRREIGPNDSIGIVVAFRMMNDGTVRVIGRVASVGAVWSVGTNDVVTRLATLPTLAPTYAAADISPDGGRVAYIARVGTNTGELRVRDLNSGAETVIAGPSRSPRWSPDGTRLAFTVPPLPIDFLDGVLTVANADGTGRRSLGTLNYSPGLTWSPDGAYLIGRAGGPLYLVRVSDKRTAFLPWSGGGAYYQPDWR